MTKKRSYSDITSGNTSEADQIKEAKDVLKVARIEVTSSNNAAAKRKYHVITRSVTPRSNTPEVPATAVPATAAPATAAPVTAAPATEPKITAPSVVMFTQLPVARCVLSTPKVSRRWSDAIDFSATTASSRNRGRVKNNPPAISNTEPLAVELPQPLLLSQQKLPNIYTLGTMPAAEQADNWDDLDADFDTETIGTIAISREPSPPIFLSDYVFAPDGRYKLKGG